MTIARAAELFDPKPWLRAVSRPHAGAIRLAGWLTVADIVPAVGFAAGLALAVGSFERGLAAALPWLALAAVSIAIRGLIAQAATTAGARAALAVKGDVRRALLDETFHGRRSGPEAMTAVVEGVEALDGQFARFAPARTAAALSPLLIIAVCAIASPIAAGIMALALIPFIAGMALAGTAAAAESRRQFEALERLSSLFLDRIRALPTLLAFQAEARTTAQLAAAADELERRTTRVLATAFLSSGVLEFFSALSVALVAVYCGFNLLRLLPFPVPETLTLTRAFFVLALAPEVYAPMRRLAAAYHDRQAAEAAAPTLAPRPAAVPVAATAPPAFARPPALTFRGVTVAYVPGAPVLSDFDLRVASGALVAVVGPSGAGKSTLLHLLLGLAPLSGGEVEADEVALSQAGSFADAVAWAGQTPMVAPGTVYDNIALAWRDASPDQVQAAADRAGLKGDLARLIDERGGGLSGGERRRLGLARALLKPAPILLLDEPTANLDSASEEALLPILRAAARGRTTLIATHSPAVWALADQVVRL